MKIAALGQVGFISRPFDLFLAEMVHFLDSRLKLLLDRERDFQRQRSNAFYQKLAHRIVDVVSDDSLTFDIACSMPSCWQTYSGTRCS